MPVPIANTSTIVNPFRELVTIGNDTDFDSDQSCELLCEFCHYGTHTVYVMGFLATLVVAFGCVANTLNARIFTHRFMRMSLLNWYYAALSISDLFVLVTGLLRDCVPRLSDYTTSYGIYNAASTLAPATQAIGCVAQTASVFLTVAMSAHRFVGVCFPFSAHRVCSKRNTRILIAAVIGFAVLFNLTRAFEVRTTEVNCTLELGAVITEPDARDFRKSQYYITYYIGWAYTIVMYVIPFSVLISLNLKVVLAIRNTSNLHRRLSVKEPNSKSREQSKEVSTSIMLVGVVIVFLVCNTPGFLANLMEVLKLVDTRDPIFSKVVDYNNLLVMINASINCFVYMSFSDKYRALLKHYLTCGCTHDAEPLVDMTMTTGM